MEYYATASRYMAEARVYCELAPATGHFLVLARQHYALEKAIFVEPSTAAWPGLKEMAAGLTPLMVASVEEGNDVIPEGSIDLVVAVHSLEQLLIPAETLRWIKRMLSRTGNAVFVVYNERSVPARLLRKRWPPYLVQPPQMYNPTSLRTSLEAQGLNVRTIVPTATHISLGELIAQGVFALYEQALQTYLPQLADAAEPRRHHGHCISFVLLITHEHEQKRNLTRERLIGRLGVKHHTSNSAAARARTGAIQPQLAIGTVLQSTSGAPKTRPRELLSSSATQSTVSI